MALYKFRIIKNVYAGHQMRRPYEAEAMQPDTGWLVFKRIYVEYRNIVTQHHVL